MSYRDPEPGDYVEDVTNHRVGVVIAFNHALDQLILEDSFGQWEAPPCETAPFAARNE